MIEQPRQMHIPFGEPCPRLSDIEAQQQALLEANVEVIGKIEYYRRGQAIAAAYVQYYRHWKDVPQVRQWSAIQSRWTHRLKKAQETTQ